MCQESQEIATTDATRGLRVVRRGDVTEVVLLDIEGRVLDVVPALMAPAPLRQTGERRAVAA